MTDDDHPEGKGRQKMTTLKDVCYRRVTKGEEAWTASRLCLTLHLEALLHPKMICPRLLEKEVDGHCLAVS